MPSPAAARWASCWASAHTEPPASRPAPTTATSTLARRPKRAVPGRSRRTTARVGSRNTAMAQSLEDGAARQEAREDRGVCRDGAGRRRRDAGGGLRQACRRCRGGPRPASDEGRAAEPTSSGPDRPHQQHRGGTGGPEGTATLGDGGRGLPAGHRPTLSPGVHPDSGGGHVSPGPAAAYPPPCWCRPSCRRRAWSGRAARRSPVVPSRAAGAPPRPRGAAGRSRGRAAGNPA